MKRVLSLSMLFWLMASSMLAAIVTEQEAKQKALEFMTARGHSATTAAATRIGQTSRRAGAPATGTDRFYLFNIGRNEGFVIVSGDDRTADILGYADSGSISINDMPDGLRYLLDSYTEEMEWLDRQEETNTSAQTRAAAPAHAAAARSAIAPLIATRWNQGIPYNNNCPEIDEEKTVTGCAATSLAQVMYYHKWPQKACTAIPAYTTTTENKNGKNYTLELNALEPTTFNWNAMTTTYSNSSTGDPADDAVAELMQYCGWSLQMCYGLSANGGSAAYNAAIPFILKTYFGYDNGIGLVFRLFYSYMEWVDLLYTELAANRPVILGGYSTGGGHSFVCDGYDTDDYFHINWGWGGSSDGYFRLSLLNPWDQGIGGSTTRDGFSLGQEAIIGIQPPTESSTKDYCFSLEGLHFSSPDENATTKTFTREDNTEDFTDISLSLTLCSYRFGTNPFDYAIQLVNSSGNVVETLTQGTESMKFNSNVYPERTIAIPSSVPDGTYSIKVVGKLSDEIDWKDCHMTERFQLSAVISGNSLTITVPIPVAIKPTAATITVEGNLTKGFEQQVTASITGGGTDYHSNIYLRVNGKNVMGRQADIPANQTVDVHFKYTPTTAGNNKLTIYCGQTIGEKEITIIDSDVSNTQELIFDDPHFNNLTTGTTPMLYGNAVRATIRVYNPSTTNSFGSQLNCSLRKYDTMNEEGIDGDYVSATVINKFITIPKSESEEPLSYKDVDFEFTGVELGKFYCLRFSYIQGYVDEKGNQKTRTANGPFSDCYEMGAGYMAYNTDGTVTIKPIETTITADEDQNHVATFVDLSAINDFTGITVNPSSNPNCLYLLPEQPAETRNAATVPEGLSGCNIIYGETADCITLTDGNDFYSPIAFSANEITYTRKFTVAANGSSGWNTIMLPFTVTRITVPDGSPVGKEVDWFHSASDTGKNFWLKVFSGDDTGTVYFDYATEMAANTPYIIAVPDNRWGAEWQMNDKYVTFHGESTNTQPIHIAATAEHAVSGNNYKFCGHTVATTLDDGYALDNAGSIFQKVTNALPTHLDAFRAWIDAVSISSFARPALAIGSGLPVSINMPTAAPTAADADLFDLQGRRLTTKPRGIYISGGKKHIAK